MTKNSTEIVEAYFAAFNAGDTQKMLSYLHPEVQHEINQGQIQVGLEAFKKFMAHMDDCYKEQLKDMAIFSSTEDAKFKGAFSTKVAGTFTDRISAEYDVHGTYLKTDGSLPEAKGQKYVIRAGSFFEVKDGKISRVTTYYNLPKWIEMVKN
jgi:steroid delta-isomerase-like uncharacterized protein